MTSNESFKKRVRARMAKTGERYNAARRALLAGAVAPGADSGWVSAPEYPDESVREATGMTWDEWVATIDAGPGRGADHTTIAAWVGAEHPVTAWWAQTVTVGYERITGKRLPGQMPDGTFTVSRSRTLPAPPAEVRDLLEDDGSRAALLPHMRAERRSREGVKSPRFALADGDTGDALGTLLCAFDEVKSGTRLTVSHSGLPSPQAADEFKEFWGEWLAALE